MGPATPIFPKPSFKNNSWKPLKSRFGNDYHPYITDNKHLTDYAHFNRIERFV